MIVKVLKAQEKNPTKGDWFSTVMDDSEELKLNTTIGDLQKLKKTQIKNRVKDAIKKKLLIIYAKKKMKSRNQN